MRAKCELSQLRTLSNLEISKAKDYGKHIQIHISKHWLFDYVPSSCSQFIAITEIFSIRDCQTFGVSSCSICKMSHFKCDTDHFKNIESVSDLKLECSKTLLLSLQSFQKSFRRPISQHYDLRTFWNEILWAAYLFCLPSTDKKSIFIAFIYLFIFI